jgi:hypothetical protein
MNQVVTLIPVSYVDALLIFNSKLEGRDIAWSVTGNLGEALRTVHVEPDYVEIVTNSAGAEQIFQAVQEYTPSEIQQVTEALPRKAVVDEKEYPISVRSYFFKFKIGSVEFRIHGDLQYRIADWDWGDKFEFDPDYVYIVGQKISVVPLTIKYNLYRGLGWTDRAEKIVRVLHRKHNIKL